MSHHHVITPDVLRQPMLERHRIGPPDALEKCVVALVSMTRGRDQLVDPKLRMANLEQGSKIDAQIELLDSIAEVEVDSTQAKTKRSWIVGHIDCLQFECDGIMTCGFNRQLELAIDEGFRQYTTRAAYAKATPAKRNTTNHDTFSRSHVDP